MIQEPTVVYAESHDEQTTANLVHTLVQFALTVRYRKNMVLLTCLASSLLGGLYYAAAPRKYAATAGLLITQSGSNLMPSALGSDGSKSGDLMSTYQTLVQSDKVAEGAVQYLAPEFRIDMAGKPREQWAGIIQQSIKVRGVRNTNLMEVTCKSKSPQAAVAMVGAVIQSYIEFLDQTHKGTTGEVIKVLTTERAEVAEKLARKEQEVLETRKLAGSLGVDGNSRIVHPMVQRALYFNDQLIEAQKTRAQLEASLTAIESAVRNGEDLQQHLMSVISAVGSQVLLSSLGFGQEDAAIHTDVKKKLLGDRASLETLQADLGPAHPQVVALVNRIRAAETYLAGYQDRINQRLAEMQRGPLADMLVQMVRQKLRDAWETETSFQARFDRAYAEAVQINGQLANLQFLEHDLARLRSLDDVLLDRLAHLDLTRSNSEVYTSVTRDPVICNVPVSPDLKIVALLSLLVGVGSGLALVYVMDILDDRFRSVEEIMGQLRLPVLALVRHLKAAAAAGIEALHVHVAPNSAESEPFRTLRTALELADSQARRIVISSAQPGDGKTTVLANLAVCYAQANKRTLLVDADLRRPGLTAMMGMKGIDGLSGLLRSTGDLPQMAAEHIRPSGLDCLDILPSGPRPTNPAELLASPRFSEFLAWAETVYDQILIDSPPALATSDTAVVGRLVDGVILVLQPEKNRRRLVIRASESFLALKIPVLGLVVNLVGSDKDHAYYGYNGEYGYGYSYGYGIGYGHEYDEAESAEGSSPDESAAPEAVGVARSGATSGGAVPRRVA